MFVSSAIYDVLREGAIAAGLTGLMILLFLGSWRSTLIVLTSIPLSILTSLCVLAVLGSTLNIMTLGGLALAVGILVDDATVAIENTYRLMEDGEDFRTAVVEGAAGIAKPALISTLSICCAFVSVLFLNGAAKYLFTPQALAVVFAMLASYGLSRTLVPIMIDVLVKKEHERKQEAKDENHKKGLFGRIHAGFERGFERFRGGYAALLHASVERRWVTGGIAGGILVLGGVLFMFVGDDYFPQIQSSQLTLHVRARSGLRIEETERLFQQVEDTIRQEVPSTSLVLDNIGLPSNNYNLAFTDGSTVALNDGQILISLKEDHPSTLGMQKRLRVVLRDKFPNAIFYFQPADIITQVLNFGLPAPIDVQVSGKDRAKNLQVAQEAVRRIRAVAGAVDVHLQQIVDAPEFFVDVDRVRAAELGLTEQQVAQNLNTSLSSSYQVSPNFWTDPTSGIPYQLAVQTPEYRTNSLSDVENTPLLVTSSGASPPNLLSNVATLHRRPLQTVASHENTQPTYDILANVQDRPLGAIEADLEPDRAGPAEAVAAGQQDQRARPDPVQGRGVRQYRPRARRRDGGRLSVDGGELPELGRPAGGVARFAARVLRHLRQPVHHADDAVHSLADGRNHERGRRVGKLDPAGDVRTRASGEDGVQRRRGSAGGGETRLRPVLMTAGAMFVGLIPMALGLGDGSEQNAALARAVLGGVAVGTCSTLLFVPFLYASLRGGEVKPLEDYA